MTDHTVTRRHLLQAGAITATGFALAACQTIEEGSPPGESASSRFAPVSNDIDWASAYAAKSDGGYNLPAIPYERVPEQFRRQIVRNRTGEGPGKLIVETRDHFLYYTMRGGRAVRYGVGLGREGFEWSGNGDVKRKAEWPKWHPPAEMIDREPKLERYRTTYNSRTGRWEGGMEPGLLNPLGARALYIYQNGKDTLYRLHGSPEWNSIGKSVSSGCVRLINQDVIDLHRRVPAGTEIVVR